MKRIREIKVENLLSVVNEGILVMYAMFVTESFLKVTMFRIRWPEHFHQMLVICMLIFLIVKLLCVCTFKLSEVVILVILTGVFLMAKEISGYTNLADVLLLILALKDVSFRKIVKVYFTTVVFLLIVTICASQIGMIENLVYHFEGRRTRQAFGVCYPTDFASFFVWLDFSWVYIRKEKLSFFEIFGLISVGIGVWYFCDARLSTAILIGSALLFMMIKLRRVYLEYKNVEMKIKVIPEWIQTILTLSIPVCALTMVLLSYFYSGELPLMEEANSILSGRLSLGKFAFEQYNVKLLGQFVPMVGYGKSSLTYLKSAEYFFVDSSFVSILVCYGFLVFAIIVFIFTYSSFRAKRRKDYYLLLLIAMIAIDCMVEHHMMEVAYNPFLFFALSDEGWRT